MEVVKNLVLGGINSIELLDNSSIKFEDYGAQFFLPNDDSKIGQLKLPNVIDSIKDLNNRVEIKINTQDVNKLLDNEPSFFKNFDLIVATELEKRQILKLNKVTRDFKRPLYVTGSHGLFGYIMADLIENLSESEKDVGNQLRTAGTKLSLGKSIIKSELNLSKDKELVTILDKYNLIDKIFESELLPQQLNRRQLKRLSPAIPLILALLDMNRNHDIDPIELKDKAIEVCKKIKIDQGIITDLYVENLTRQGFTEFSSSSAILGGCLAQDIIQFLGKKESPINNVLILDGLRAEMPIFSL